MKKGFLCLSVICILFIFSGCNSSEKKTENVKGKIQVIVVDRMQTPIKDSRVIFISNNKYQTESVTDEQGKTKEIEIDAQLDPLVKEIMDKNFQRGVVNIIVTKNGYRDDVVFEAWINKNTTTTQIIKLDKNIEGERNEPEYTVNEPHRLEVIKYVEYYKNLAK